MESFDFKGLCGIINISNKAKEVIMNHEILTNELDEETKLLINKLKLRMIKKLYNHWRTLV